VAESNTEIIRRAAAHMRARAEAATPGPWIAKDSGRHVTIFGTQHRYVADAGVNHVDQVHRDAAHIAAMHPGVALAVADWLDAEAAAHEGGMGVSDALRDLVAEVSASEYDVQVAVSTLKQAVAVARAYLDES
jgi:hypothetical protein